MVYLYRQGKDGWGRYLARNDDGPSPPWSEIETTLDQGTYQVMVKGYWRSTQGPFSLLVHCPDCPPSAPCSPLPPNAPAYQRLQELYFDPDLVPWRTCYTTTPERALEIVRAAQFAGASEIIGETARLEGEKVIVKLRYREGDAEIGRCVFDRSDECVLENCLIEFSDCHDPDQPLAANLDKERQCAEVHPELAGKYVDCAEGLAHPITNTWRQSLPRFEYKTMRHIIEATTMNLQVAATGSVSPSGSLDPCMDWSAVLAFTFLRRMMHPEVCDYALSAMTPDWQGSWCPWCIEVVRVECDGMTPLYNLRAVVASPLDRADAEVKAFCGY